MYIIISNIAYIVKTTNLIHTDTEREKEAIAILVAENKHYFLTKSASTEFKILRV